MGPITLFDKSFLQGLRLDEAVLFDYFFLTNIAPVYFVETLADLEKALSSGRTPEEEVGIIAAKTPQVASSPNMFHGELCIGSLLGKNLPMDGRIVLPGGRQVRSGDKTGVVFEESREEQAFSRWQEGDFLDVERRFAKAWRGMLAVLNFDDMINEINALGVNLTSCRSLEESKQIAHTIVSGRANYKLMLLALKLLEVPATLTKSILGRWKKSGYPRLKRFAPYAAYVVSVDLFFYIATAAQLFSMKKITNRIDLAYLYYLPFCMVFTSSDRFHQRCAPLFLRSDQQFVWGLDLKAALKDLHEYYQKLPDVEKEKGLSAIASQPPLSKSNLVIDLWDRFLPKWREAEASEPQRDPDTDAHLIRQLRQFSDAPSVSREEEHFDATNMDYIVLKRKIRKKRGSYWQLPKNLKTEDS